VGSRAGPACSSAEEPHRTAGTAASADAGCPGVAPGPELRARHEPGRTKIALAPALVDEAMRRQGPCGVVVFDAWSLAEDVVRVLARRRSDWISRLKPTRRLETASVHRRDANGWTRKRPGPHLAVEQLVPLIPATAYPPVTVGEHPSWCCTLGVRIPGLGKVRLVVRVEPATVTGRQVVLVTNRVDWSAAQLSSRYGPRWPTDTCDQDGQGPWGVNAYRMRRAEAIGTHGCLVCVAAARWHLTCRPAEPDRTPGLIHPSGDAGRQQGRAWLQRLLRFVHDP
jgi:hypothetical protein